MTPIYDDLAATFGDPLDADWFQRRTLQQLQDLRDLFGVLPHAHDTARVIAAALNRSAKPRPVTVARTGRWRHARRRVAP